MRCVLWRARGGGELRGREIEGEGGGGGREERGGKARGSREERGNNYFQAHSNLYRASTAMAVPPYNSKLCESGYLCYHHTVYRAGMAMGVPHTVH